MARDEAPPFARGETYSNSQLAADIDTTNLGGVNLEGKEFVFEPNSQDNFTGTYSNASTDVSGRPVRVKVVRNYSGVNLKPARIAHFLASTTSAYECAVDGYCFAAGDRPAGVVDEMLPAVGVQPNDLFYIVIGGPTKVTNTSATPGTFAIGDRLQPATSGATAGDDLAGRAAVVTLTGATSVLANNILGIIGNAASTNSTSNGQFNAVIHRRF